MKVLILYYSKGGNTRRMAEDIAKGVESSGVEAVLKSTVEVSKDDFLNASGVIAGSPVYFGLMAADLKRCRLAGHPGDVFLLNSEIPQLILKH